MQSNNGTMLKIAGIVLGIWGVIAFSVNLKDFLDYRSIFIAVGGAALFSVIILIASTAVMIIAGILGFLNRDNPAKAGLCQTVGTIALVLLWVGIIMMLVTYGSEAVNWVFTLIGTVLTAWYIFGARKLGEGR